jgi:hypothetical protein
LQEVSGNGPEAMADVQGNSTAKGLDGQQNAEAVPLFETATHDVRTESVEPDHKILASWTPPMDLSTAPHHEFTFGVSAVGTPVNIILRSGSDTEIQSNQYIDSNQRPLTYDAAEGVEIRESPNPTASHVHTVLSVKTHMQPSQTAQRSEDRAGSEATEVATPISQKLGSFVNPITIPDDPLIIDDNGGVPIIVEDAEKTRGNKDKRRPVRRDMTHPLFESSIHRARKNLVDSTSKDFKILVVWAG